MNTHLADHLDRSGIAFEAVSKSAKVKLLARWSAEFAGLLQHARHGQSVPGIVAGSEAQEQMRNLETGSFYVLPDDESGMATVLCRHRAVPDLWVLLSDTVTKCDEIVVVDTDFGWSCVLVNHGASGVGWYFMQAGGETGRG